MIDYLHEVQRAYERRLENLNYEIANSENSRQINQAEKEVERISKQLKEVKDYDEKIGHLALARIGIDLDDGVKINYEKVQTDEKGKKLEILAKIQAKIQKTDIIYTREYFGGGQMNTAKDRIKKLIDEIPETKAGEIIDFLLFIKNKAEEDLFLSVEEEEEIWENIKNDERFTSKEAKKILLGEDDG